MNQLAFISSASVEALSMTSREIADLVGSRHDSVKRTIERLSESGVIQLPPTVEVKNHQKEMIEPYELLAALNLIEVDKDGDGFVCRDAMVQVRAAVAATEQP